MRVIDVIIKKRNGLELTDEEIRFIIKELVDGRMEDSQLGTYFILFFMDPVIDLLVEAKILLSSRRISEYQ